jgi:small GTP-binding protein
VSSPSYKICLIGDGAVGKTALRDRFVGKLFSEEYKMTMGADVTNKAIAVRGKEVNFQVWDIAGQPFFQDVRQDYYRGALGALAVYDISNYESYGNVRNWVTELWAHNGKGRVPIVILGNKSDLRESLTEAVTLEEALILASELTWAAQEEGFTVSFLETSAKIGTNVLQAFEQLAENIMEFIDAKLAEDIYN